MINLIQKGYEEYGLTLEGNSFNFNYVYSLWANRSGDDGKDKQRYICFCTSIEQAEQLGDKKYAIHSKNNNSLKILDNFLELKQKVLREYCMDCLLEKSFYMHEGKNPVFQKFFLHHRQYHLKDECHEKLTGSVSDAFFL